MKFVARIAIFTSLSVTFVTHAHAQVGGMWGAGAYGGMQACPYPNTAGDGASLYQDEINETKEAIAEMKRQLSAKKSEKRRLDRTDLKKSSDRIDNYFVADYGTFIREHIENTRQCSDYKGLSGKDEPIAAGEEGGEEIEPIASIPVSGFRPAEWAKYCDGTRPGNVMGSVCDAPKFRSPDNKRVNALDCKKSLADYRKQYSQSMKLQNEIEGLEENIRAANESIKETQRLAREELREQQKMQTEGGICVNCMTQGSGYTYQRQEPSWGNVVANVGLGLLGMYSGYQQNKAIMQQNGNLGWATQPVPALGYGYPFLAAGLYGALGGGIGSGAFGCAAGMHGAGFGNGAMGMMGPFGMGSMYPGMNGGVFGYPGMGYPGFGGGMYMPGMGPWGSAGPWGTGGAMGGMGMGYPMGGGFPMGAVGGIGGVMGMPMGGGMMGMPMGGGMMGYPMGGGMMGMPMGGVGGIGGMMGMPMGGGMMGYPMGGGMMGMPMGGVGGIGGVMGMPMGGGMMGYPMGGGGMMGMPIGAAGGIGGMMGMPMGGMMGMPVGGAMGYPMMGGVDGGLGSIQMQQQMMEMQMRQYQMLMEQQRRTQEDALNRQRVVAGLQQELYSLVYRIQQIQMGYGSSSYIGGGTLNSGTGVFPGGIPGGIPGGVNPGLGPVPGGSGGGNATTPLGPIPGGR